MDPSSEESLFASENTPSSLEAINPNNKNPALSEINKAALLGLNRQDSIDLVLDVMKENCSNSKENTHHHQVPVVHGQGNSLHHHNWIEDMNLNDFVKYMTSDSNSTTPNILNTPPTHLGVNSTPQTPGTNPLFVGGNPFSVFTSLSPVGVLSNNGGGGGVSPNVRAQPHPHTQERGTTPEELLQDPTRMIPAPISQDSQVPASPSQNYSAIGSAYSPQGDHVSLQSTPLTSSARPRSTQSTVQWHAPVELKREPPESPFTTSPYSPARPLSAAASTYGFPAPSSNASTVFVDEDEEAMELGLECRETVKRVDQIKKEPSVKPRQPRKYNRIKVGKDSKEYRDRRDKNNEAVRKSREKAKLRIEELKQRNEILEDQNRVLIEKYDAQSATLRAKEAQIQTLKQCLEAANARNGLTSRTTHWPRK